MQHTILIKTFYKFNHQSPHCAFSCCSLSNWSDILELMQIRLGTERRTLNTASSNFWKF